MWNSKLWTSAASSNQEQALWEEPCSFPTALVRKNIAAGLSDIWEACYGNWTFGNDAWVETVGRCKLNGSVRNNIGLDCDWIRTAGHKTLRSSSLKWAIGREEETLIQSRVTCPRPVAGKWGKKGKGGDKKKPTEALKERKTDWDIHLKSYVNQLVCILVGMWKGWVAG